MKNKLILALICLLASCQERGTINSQPQDFIEIHGKVYKLISIVPSKGAHSIWIMYPKDSTDKMPQVLNYNVQSGKTSYNQSVIKID